MRKGDNWVQSVVRRGYKGAQRVAKGVQRGVEDSFEDNAKCTAM